MAWPTSPSNGQQTSINGIVYQYDGANAVWNRLYSSINSTTPTYVATVSQGAQPNITSVGILANVQVVGAGSIYGANAVSANYVSGTLTTAPQPNITSVGTLNSLTATGVLNFTTSSNVSLGPNSNVHITGGSSGQYLQTDGSGGLTWSTINTTVINNGSSNVLIPTSGSNIAMTVGGVANVVVVHTGGAVVTSTLTVTGNVSSTNANLGNLVTSNYFAGTLTTNAQPNITSVGTLNGVTLGGSTSLSGANLVSANYVAGTLTTNAQPNITSLGTLSGLTIAGNLTVSGTFEYANVSSFRIKDPLIEQGGNTDGTALTTNDGYDRGQILHYYSGAPVDAFMGWDNSNTEFAFGSNVSVAAEVVTFNTFGNVRANWHLGTGVSVSGNVSSGNANLGNLITSNYYAGTLTTNAQPNITSVGTLVSLTSGLITATTGGVKVGNIQDPSGTNTISLASGAVTMVGNLTIGTGGTGNLTATNANLGNLVVANYVTGTLTTAAQPNITSHGTLTALTVAGPSVLQQTQEKFTALTGATGLVAHDFSLGATFYHTGVAANFTCGVTNFNSTASRTTLIAVVIEQGSTAYYPSAFSISTTATANATTQSIKWSGGVAPTPTASKTEVVVFTVFNNSGTYNVLGQLASYG